METTIFIHTYVFYIYIYRYMNICGNRKEILRGQCKLIFENCVCLLHNQARRPHVVIASFVVEDDELVILIRRRKQSQQVQYQQQASYFSSDKRGVFNAVQAGAAVIITERTGRTRGTAL